MTQKIKSVLCLLIVALLLGAVMVACASPEDPNKNSPTPTPTGTVTATPTPNPADTVPDYLKEVAQREGERKTFTILTRDANRDEVYMKEDDVAGDLIAQSIFNRNSTVEEYMNVDIDYMDVPSSWSDMAQVISIVRESVTTEDGAYDLASTYMAYSGDMAKEGLFYNLLDLDNFNSESPWWVKGYVDNNIVYDHMFMVVGDLSLSMWKNIYVTYFSKNMATNLGITDELYALANNGEWTMEKLMAYSAQVAMDNGDDRWDTDDTYGLLLNSHILRATATCFGVDLTERNDDGGFDLCMYNDHSVEIYAQIAEWLKDDSVYVTLLSDGDTTATLPIFMENRALFFMGALDLGSNLRTMDTDFGIVPIPKYDDNQEDYRSHSYDGFSVFSIPSTHEDPEFVAWVMEALNAESKHSVIPNYYDIVLKSRTTRDTESSGMIDIARDSLCFDFGFTHCSAMEYMLSLWGDQLAKGASSFTTVYETKATVFETKLEKLMELYADMY